MLETCPASDELTEHGANTLKKTNDATSGTEIEEQAEKTKNTLETSENAKIAGTGGYTCLDGDRTGLRTVSHSHTWEHPLDTEVDAHSE